MSATEPVKKVIVRVRGGIGNQLFCYATAFALARRNGAELVVDSVTGFERDWKYQRKYLLDRFEASARLCTANERLEPFSRLRRYFMRQYAERQPFARRRYLAQQTLGFDARVRDYIVADLVYLDGYWQSYLYFQGFADQLRQELKVSFAPPDWILAMAATIRSHNAVAVHFRCFDHRNQERQFHSIEAGYYARAVDVISRIAQDPCFYVFSDDLDQARQRFSQFDTTATYVDTRRETDSALLDLWLMTQCQNHIIANSTFSWWAAWLSPFSNKTVIAPSIKCRGVGAWGFDGLLPDEWLLI